MIFEAWTIVDLRSIAKYEDRNLAIARSLVRIWLKMYSIPRTWKILVYILEWMMNWFLLAYFKKKMFILVYEVSHYVKFWLKLSKDRRSRSYDRDRITDNFLNWRSGSCLADLKVYVKIWKPKLQWFRNGFVFFKKLCFSLRKSRSKTKSHLKNLLRKKISAFL